MAESFNLNRVLQEQNSYVQRQYTAGENGRAAMEQRELQNAQKAIEAQSGFLSLTLEEKIKEIMVPERVLQEFSDVAIKTLTGAVQPFLDWLEENEVYYTDNLFNTAIQADAKQLFYTKWALSKEASDAEVGTQFYASY
jgi:hypothetical protein